jgi:hypothetical protein
MAAEGQFDSLCLTTDHRLMRRWKTTRKVRAVLREGDVLHVPAPTPEGYWGHLTASRRGIPVIAEIVGDPETGVLEEDGRGLIRESTRRRSISARRARGEICRAGSAAPALRKSCGSLEHTFEKQRAKEARPSRGTVRTLSGRGTRRAEGDLQSRHRREDGFEAHRLSAGHGC